MPIIARFYSILIKMYYIEDEHNPPHIHAKYNEYEGIFNIETGVMTRGNLPKTLNILLKNSSLNIGIDSCLCGKTKILKN